MNGPQKGARSTTIRYFGDYILLGEIAGGGMGVVFNARQVSLNRKVAVKLIRGGPVAGESELRRFRTEAEAAARLDHPHIVPIYEIGEHEGQPFIAMKLVEGDSLAERLTNENSSTPASVFAIEQAAALVAKIGRAVQHAHQHGVLHRDIKPGNILLDAGGEPYLTDFGLAKLLERDSSQTVSWRLLQNSNQVIFTDNIDAGVPGSVWTPRAHDRQWRDVAMSADATKLIAADFGYRQGGGALYTSSDGGTSWTQHDSKRLWTSVTMAADGSRLIAAAVFSRIYLSTNFGASWTPHGTRRNWTDLAASADGLRLVALDAGTNTTGGQIYTSNDGGLNWTPHESDRNWCAVASSADGSKLLAAVGEADIKGHPIYGYLYNSTDYGVTWTACLMDEPRRWLGVASSADGTKLIAVEHDSLTGPGGRIHLSADSGKTWSVANSFGYWMGTASSPDGKRLIVLSHLASPAGAAAAQVHISIDSGLTWSVHQIEGAFARAAWSADGRKLVTIAGSFEGGHNNNIYTSVATTTPGPAGAFAGEPGAELDLQYVGDGQFRIVHAVGRFTVEGREVQATLKAR